MFCGLWRLVWCSSCWHTPPLGRGSQQQYLGSALCSCNFRSCRRRETCALTWSGHARIQVLRVLAKMPRTSKKASLILMLLAILERCGSCATSEAHVPQGQCPQGGLHVPQANAASQLIHEFSRFWVNSAESIAFCSTEKHKKRCVLLRLVILTSCAALLVFFSPL